MRLLPRIADHAELVFDVIWGFIGIAIIALAFGIATFGYDSHEPVIASNVNLPPIQVEAAVQ
jgi:hypothetical protein